MNLVLAQVKVGQLNVFLLSTVGRCGCSVSDCCRFVPGGMFSGCCVQGWWEWLSVVVMDVLFFIHSL